MQDVALGKGAFLAPGARDQAAGDHKNVRIVVRQNRRRSVRRGYQALRVLAFGAFLVEPALDFRRDQRLDLRAEDRLPGWVITALRRAGRIHTLLVGVLQRSSQQIIRQPIIWTDIRGVRIEVAGVEPEPRAPPPAKVIVDRRAPWSICPGVKPGRIETDRSVHVEGDPPVDRLPVEPRIGDPATDVGPLNECIPADRDGPLHIPVAGGVGDDHSAAGPRHFDTPGAARSMDDGGAAAGLNHGGPARRGEVHRASVGASQYL